MLQDKNMRLNYMKTSSLLLILSAFILSISACNLIEINQEINKVDSTGIIKGKIKLQTDQSGPVIVNRYYLQNKTYISDTFSRANFLGNYQFDSYPGSYFISAFVDNNHDGL